MGNNEMKILYEIIVKYDKPKFDTKLTITEKTINLEKKKGLFKKVYKIIDSINVDDIKIHKDKVLVTNKNTEIEIETNNKTYKFTCNNMIEAKKLTEEIIKIKTRANLLESTSSKVIKFIKTTKKTIKTIGTIVASVGALAIAINENKEKIAKSFVAIKDLFKKN